VSAVFCLYSLVSRHTLYMLIFINHNEITSDFLFKIKKLIVSQIYKSMCIHESYVNMCVYVLYFSTHFHTSQPNSAKIFEFSNSTSFDLLSRSKFGARIIGNSTCTIDREFHFSNFNLQISEICRKAINTVVNRSSSEGHVEFLLPRCSVWRLVFVDIVLL